MTLLQKSNYRPGQIGALMDEYERAAGELNSLIKTISEDTFVKIVDEQTNDENCRSVQSIVSHVINSGYTYADYLREYFGLGSSLPGRALLSKQEFLNQLILMLRYTSESLEDHWEMTDEEVQKAEIKSRWGSIYDIEQLLEHAIVHILRHRRQIEKFFASGKISLI